MNKYIHIKSGRTYQVITDKVINTTNAQDGQSMVLYSTLDGAITYVREITEFIQEFKPVLPEGELESPLTKFIKLLMNEVSKVSVDDLNYVIDNVYPGKVDLTSLSETTLGYEKVARILVGDFEGADLADNFPVSDSRDSTNFPNFVLKCLRNAGVPNIELWAKVKDLVDEIGY